MNIMLRLLVIAMYGALAAHTNIVHADIIQYESTDGRRIFSNTRPHTRLAPTQRSHRARLAAQKRTQIMALVYPLAQKYDINAYLVKAIITVESNFNARAVSSAGAKGLMQLMPATAARFGVDKVFNPRANIEGGMRYLKILWQRYQGDIRRVLAAYNAGETAVKRYGGIPPYPETQRYVTRVLALYKQYAAPKIYRYQTAQGSILFTDTPR